ncbi:unnamed protein product [Agarophyton chilense]
MAVAPDAATVAVFGGRSLYAYLGGRYFDSHVVHVLHAERALWTPLRVGGALAPTARAGCVLHFVSDRVLFMHGGCADDGERCFDDAMLFDLADGKWHHLPYPHHPFRPAAREGHAVAALPADHRLLMYGGASSNNVLSDLAVFDTARLRWAPPPAVLGASPGRLVNAAMAPTAHRSVVLVGGDNGFSMSPHTFELRPSHRSKLAPHRLVRLAAHRGPDAVLCVVCLDQRVTTLFLWCAHSVCCASCARLVREECPVCRKPFSRVVYNVFDSS